MTGFYTALRPLVEHTREAAKTLEPGALDFCVVFGLGHDGALASAC